MVEVLIDQALTPELERPVDFGTEIERPGFYAIIADRPLGICVRKLFERANVPLPADQAPLFERFELWLIPHRLSLMRRFGSYEPISVGMEVEYLNEGKTCSIAGLFPSFQYKVHASLGAWTKLAARVSLTGDMKATESVLGTGLMEPLSDLTSFHVHADVGSAAYLRLETVLATPIISAVGLGSSRCEWRLDKDREPLVGRDIETWATVVLPTRQTRLKHRIRFSLTHRPLWLTREQSDWKELTCELVR